jgi:hypothetical protein
MKVELPTNIRLRWRRENEVELPTNIRLRWGRNSRIHGWGASVSACDARGSSRDTPDSRLRSFSFSLRRARKFRRYTPDVKFLRP